MVEHRVVELRIGGEVFALGCDEFGLRFFFLGLLAIFAFEHSQPFFELAVMVLEFFGGLVDGALPAGEFRMALFLLALPLFFFTLFFVRGFLLRDFKFFLGLLEGTFSISSCVAP
jgi:hypothetical protein